MFWEVVTDALTTVGVDADVQKEVVGQLQEKVPSAISGATAKAARAQVASEPSGAVRAAAVMRLVRHCHRRPVQHLPGPIPSR